MPSTPRLTTERSTVDRTDAALALVSEALDRIRFGDIRLTIHEGRLVQIDVTEKTRLAPS